MAKNALKLMAEDETSGDPYEPYRNIWLGTLASAISTSVMASNSRNDYVLQSPGAMANMIEARMWLMDPSNGIGSRNYCLSAGPVTKDRLIRKLRHLWRTREQDMRGTIRKHLGAVRRPVRGGERRLMRNTKINRLAHEAMDVLKQSNRWAGV